MISAEKAKELTLSSNPANFNLTQLLREIELNIEYDAKKGNTISIQRLTGEKRFFLNQVYKELKSQGFTVGVNSDDAETILSIIW